MTKPFFISTSIPYVNANPHIGHTLEFVQADVIARLQRQNGRDVYFLSGTDDNALKNVQAAENAGEYVKEWVDRHAEAFEKLTDESVLNLSNDDFIKTSSDPRHTPGAQKLWKSCKRADIFKKKYSGLYCVGCEEFKTEKELINGECPEHPGQKPEIVEEENYFFRLSNYQDKLRELIDSDKFKITPESRKNEMLSFIDGGLKDFSISRSRERARGWGVPVPGDDSQIMYVWFDALSNYITALGYADDGENYNKYWNSADAEVVHIIGKGINRFHTIYWPAMLLSAGVRLPTEVFVHGYITVDGQKISKSLGNVIDPVDIAKRYGVDVLRYFLLRHVHPFEDSDYTEDKFKEVYNANLANGLGNLVSRILKMSEEHLDINPSGDSRIDVHEFLDFYNNFEFQHLTDAIWAKIGLTDEKIAQTEPFKLIKSDPDKAISIIRELVMDLSIIANLLAPLLPATSEKIKAAIKENRKPDTLFPRLET
jgi:methionyl-tRNA synthetase